jgi:hypothetical protein|tara:strand:+ start:11824 stop:12705 length:882 start_codon:yes stop_codon:yes gene_type:complete
MTAVAAIIIGGVSLITAGAQLFAGSKESQRLAQLQKDALDEQRRRNAEIAELEMSRQEVVDMSDEIRDMKDDVLNPYQNLGVAMSGIELQMEETDEALANILNNMNRAGVGAGAATQLARSAAASKLKVAAQLENQELANQKQYLAGEAQKLNTIMSLEQAALKEEINVYGRQEGRDIARLDRLAGLATNAGQMGMDYGVASSNAMMSGVAGASSTIVAGAGAAANTIPTPTPTQKAARQADKQEKKVARQVKRTKRKDERNFIEDSTAMAPQSASDDMYNNAIEMFENNNMA